MSEALNARDYDTARTLLSPNMHYVDLAGSRIDGPADYIEAQRALHRLVPDLRGVMSEVLHNGDEVMVKGRFESRQASEFNVEGMWTICFDGALICSIATYRAGNAIPLLQILRQSRQALTDNPTG